MTRPLTNEWGSIAIGKGMLHEHNGTGVGSLRGYDGLCHLKEVGRRGRRHDLLRRVIGNRSSTECRMLEGEQWTTEDSVAWPRRGSRHASLEAEEGQ